MNRILIKSLISLFLIRFIFSSSFESWLSQIKYTLENSSAIQLTMSLESIEINNVDNNIVDNEFYLILNLSKDIYQIKYLDNIIYYNRSIVLQHNQTNNQLFKYFPDKKIEDYFDKNILKEFFNFNNYKIDDSVEEYQYIYNNFILDLDDNIYIDSSSDLIRILFLDDVYKIEFNNIIVDSIDADSFDNQLLINQYKDNKDIEIFDFTK